MSNSNNIRKATQEEHDAAIALMRTFMDSDKPKVGIFWYDFVNKSLFGVSKIEAESLSAEGDIIKYSQTHEIYWEEQHRGAIAKDNIKSIYYNNDNFTKIPSGRVCLENGTYYVYVGSWINDSDLIDTDKLRELVIDEFDLPEETTFRYDAQMDM